MAKKERIFVLTQTRPFIIKFSQFKLSNEWRTISERMDERQEEERQREEEREKGEKEDWQMCLLMKF